MNCEIRRINATTHLLTLIVFVGCAKRSTITGDHKYIDDRFWSLFQSIKHLLTKFFSLWLPVLTRLFIQFRTHTLRKSQTIQPELILNHLFYIMATQYNRLTCLTKDSQYDASEFKASATYSHWLMTIWFDMVWLL